MRIKCNECGKPVSTLVPKSTALRAWVECPECVQGLIAVMEEVLEGKGAFDLDPLKHCSNTIDNMKELTKSAIEKMGGK